ncbi:MAG: metallophosphoesterase [Lachnospiraceae bacterium]|nr:metallophosphoesterase [Lachnospiraceae bacterium]
MATYVVSDIHGYKDALEKGLEKIGFGEDDFLYVVGDAIDRGVSGISILRHIKDHPNMDLILGNHEFLMLNSVNVDGYCECDGTDSDLWLYYNGGMETYYEYEDLSDDERIELLEWLRSRYLIKTLQIGESHFCLTHSYYIPECENKIYSELGYQQVWDIVWRSMYRSDTTHCHDVYSEYDYIFITGHVPVQRVRRDYVFDDGNPNVLKPVRQANLIDIDGGCAMGYNPVLKNGALFLRLDDMEVFPVRL